MRENLYTCCRCGTQARTPDESAEPVGWACVSYRRVGSTGEQTQLTALTTHACTSCADEVLSFLEKAVPTKTDDEGSA